MYACILYWLNIVFVNKALCSRYCRQCLIYSIDAKVGWGWVMHISPHPHPSPRDFVKAVILNKLPLSQKTHKAPGPDRKRSDLIGQRLMCHWNTIHLFPLPPPSLSFPFLPCFLNFMLIAMFPFLPRVAGVNQETQCQLPRLRWVSVCVCVCVSVSVCTVYRSE